MNMFNYLAKRVHNVKTVLSTDKGDSVRWAKDELKQIAYNAVDLDRLVKRYGKNSASYQAHWRVFEHNWFMAYELAKDYDK